MTRGLVHILIAILTISVLFFYGSVEVRMYQEERFEREKVAFFEAAKREFDERQQRTNHILEKLNLRLDELEAVIKNSGKMELSGKES